MTRKIIGKSFQPKEVNKPSTVTRAAITADIKYTRGRQLVEHNPFKLLPDPHNPRPGEIIDDEWLKRYLFLGTEKSLCKIDTNTQLYEIPDLNSLGIEFNASLEESYSFLRELAYSIRNEGLIEPIEIFLADKANEPEYFENNNFEYGYVILEGHQRRLAAMMAGVPSITCIEITDESMLAKLKIKHRKLRRQLSENNIRKGLTVSQNFNIVQILLNEEGGKNISARELSSIIGLNEAISAALKKISSNISEYPHKMIVMINNNELTYSQLRNLVSKPFALIEKELNSDTAIIKGLAVSKPRGRKGGAIKKSATFKIKDFNESNALQKMLLSRFPELEMDANECSFKSLEKLLEDIKRLAFSSVT